MIALAVLAGVLFGAAIGSFIGCAIYRVPRGISLISPPSSCPGCGHRLRPAELIPVISFMKLGGRAQCCGARLSPAYFWVELICAAFGGCAAYLIFA